MTSRPIIWTPGRKKRGKRLKEANERKKKPERVEMFVTVAPRQWVRLQCVTGRLVQGRMVTSSRLRRDKLGGEQ